MAHVVIRDPFKLPTNKSDLEWASELDAGDRDPAAYHERTLIALFRGNPLTDDQRQDLVRRVRINPIRGSHKREPVDIVDIGARTPLLSPRAHAIVEKAAPGRYEFFEMETFKVAPESVSEGDEASRDPVSIGSWFMLHGLPRIDCVDYDVTTFRQGAGFSAGGSSMFFIPIGGRLVLKADVVEGHHVWSTPHLRDRNLFVSNELHSAFVEAGITGWHYEPCDVRPATVVPAK